MGEILEYILYLVVEWSVFSQKANSFVKQYLLFMAKNCFTTRHQIAQIPPLTKGICEQYSINNEFPWGSVFYTFSIKKKYFGSVL